MITADKPEVNPLGRYTISETARLLGVARSTIYTWIRKGKIKTKRRRLDFAVIIPGSEIQALWAAIN